jgi:hypothetical protein
MSEKSSETVETEIKVPENWDKLIETKIENKFNQVMDILPKAENIKIKKMIKEYTISELYNETLETIINIINETSELLTERKYLSNKTYISRLFTIFLKEERKYFLGIVLIILSFIIYFIDGSSI